MKKNFIFFISIFIGTSVFAQNECNNSWSFISPDGNYIYFSSDRSGDYYEIFRVDIDGYSNPVQLTNTMNVDKFFPSVSPDGSLIVFQTGSYGAEAEIFIMDSDGNNLQQLTSNNIYDGYPNFSPDGSKIVFDAWDGSQYPEIFTMNIDGSGRTQLTNISGAYWQSAPIYNPSGTKIYFSAGYNADNHYVMMDLDGTNWVNITDPNTFGYMDWGLHFNADGTKIIFQTSEWVGYSNGSDIVIANADGSDWDRLTNTTNSIYYHSPFIHPDNGKIYFTFYDTNGTGRNSIHTMNMDGTGDEEISDCSSSTSIEDNTENNQQLVYPNPVKNIMTVNIENTAFYEVFEISGRSVLKSYQPRTSVIQLTPGLYFLVVKDKNHKILAQSSFIKE